MQVLVREVESGTAGFGDVLALARALAQDRHLSPSFPHALESHVLGAFDDSRCVGFLRYLVQVIGAEEGRPAVMRNGEPLREGYVEAFGVDPQWRRRGVGTKLQRYAARNCRMAGCYQMRSRSPVTSTENYAMKSPPGTYCIPVQKTTPTTFSSACDRPGRPRGGPVTCGSRPRRSGNEHLTSRRSSLDLLRTGSENSVISARRTSSGRIGYRPRPRG